MATAGSRTSSSGLLDSNECTVEDSRSGAQGGGSAPSLPNSPGRVKRNAGENAQWRRKELRKVRSVDLEKAEGLQPSSSSTSTADTGGTAPIAAQLHYFSVSSPAAVQASLSQQCRHVQHSNSLSDHPLLDKASLCTGAQDLHKTSCKSSSSEQISTDHATSAELNPVQQR